MTTQTQTPAVGAAAAKTPRGGSLGAPELPQVDLLPPEIRESRGLAVLKRRLLLVVIAAVLVAILGYGGAVLVKSEAQSRVDAAQDDATRLLVEKRKYFEVTNVIKAIGTTQEAREFSVSAEVLWRPYIEAISAILPQDVTLDSFSVAQGTPSDLFNNTVTAADLLSDPGVGSVSFVARSATLPDASEWIDALEAIPGFTDATLQSSQISDKGEETYYSVACTVQVAKTALSGRTFEETK